jgi:hypothetical protein
VTEVVVVVRGVSVFPPDDWSPAGAGVAVVSAGVVTTLMVVVVP